MFNIYSLYKKAIQYSQLLNSLILMNIKTTEYMSYGAVKDLPFKKLYFGPLFQRCFSVHVNN